MTRQAEITLQVQPLLLLPDVHIAAANAAKLHNNPAYARLCLIQAPCGQWLLCRVLADAVPPMALRLPETPAFTTGGLPHAPH